MSKENQITDQEPFESRFTLKPFAPAIRLDRDKLEAVAGYVDAPEWGTHVFGKNGKQSKALTPEVKDQIILAILTYLATKKLEPQTISIADVRKLGNSIETKVARISRDIKILETTINDLYGNKVSFANQIEALEEWVKFSVDARSMHGSPGPSRDEALYTLIGDLAEVFKNHTGKAPSRHALTSNKDPTGPFFRLVHACLKITDCGGPETAGSKAEITERELAEAIKRVLKPRPIETPHN